MKLGRIYGDRNTLCLVPTIMGERLTDNQKTRGRRAKRFIGRIVFVAGVVSCSGLIWGVIGAELLFRYKVCDPNTLGYGKLQHNPSFMAGVTKCVYMIGTGAICTAIGSVLVFVSRLISPPEKKKLLREEMGIRAGYSGRPRFGGPF